MNIEQYLTVPYIDGGRDIAVGLDCWGLVRHVLHAEFEKPLFEGFAGIDRHGIGEMNKGYKASVSQFKQCEPKAGAVACCFYMGGDGLEIFHHVGVCINDHQVLHTSSKKGAGILKVRAFKRIAATVKFYEFVEGKA